MTSDATQVRDGSPRHAAQTAAQDVPPGYKRTDVGVVPKDWRASQLGDFGTLRSGNGFPLKHQGRREGDYPFFKVSDMNNPGNELFMDCANHWIDEDVRRALSAEVFPAGSIVFAKIGAAIFLERKRLLVRDSCLDNNMMAYVLTDRGASTRFFHYVLLRVELAKLVSTTALPSLSGRQIASIRVPIPAPAEQRAIAEALSDVDGLLGALQALIAKKRVIKQAAMQQLLTGKTRLPGFSGEWETKRLGEIASIRNQKVMPSQVAPTTPCVELEHIGQGNGRLTTNSTAAASTSSKYLFFAGDVLFGRLRPYLRKYWHAEFDGICTTEIWPLVADSTQADSGFLHGVVQTDRFIESASISYGTHMPRADWGVMRNFEIRVPSVEEQTAIATVLSDMDAEIAALEARRDKTRAIKQGMMQQLLTGRVRLVKLEVAA